MFCEKNFKKIKSFNLLISFFYNIRALGMAIDNENNWLYISGSTLGDIVPNSKISNDGYWELFLIKINMNTGKLISKEKSQCSTEGSNLSQGQIDKYHSPAYYMKTQITVNPG